MSENEYRIRPPGHWSHFPSTLSYGEAGWDQRYLKPQRQERPTWTEVFFTLVGRSYRRPYATLVVTPRASARILELRFWDDSRLDGLQGFTCWVYLNPHWPHQYRNVFRSLWLWSFHPYNEASERFLSVGELLWFFEECRFLFPDLFREHEEWERQKARILPIGRSGHTHVPQPYSHTVENGHLSCLFHRADSSWDTPAGPVEVPHLPYRLPASTTG